MKLIITILLIFIGGNSNANWFYLNFNDKVDQGLENSCIDIGEYETPKTSLENHIGTGKFRQIANFTFQDKSKMISFITKKNSSFIYTNNLEKCLALRKSITKSAKTAVYLANECDIPKFTGTVELEVAGALAIFGDEKIKIMVNAPNVAVLKFYTGVNNMNLINIYDTQQSCKNKNINPNYDINNIKQITGPSLDSSLSSTLSH